jgi:hypothetical protein
LSTGDDRIVHETASGLVMTRLPVPDKATATKRGEPPGVPKATQRQALSTGEKRVVHTTPRVVGLAEGVGVEVPDGVDEGEVLLVVVLDAVALGEIDGVTVGLGELELDGLDETYEDMS